MADVRYVAAYEASLEAVEAAEKEVAEKKKVSNMLAGLAGIDAPFADVEAPAAAGLASIRNDQFTSIGAPSVAVRAYLEMRGKEKGSQAFDQIYEALRRGGFVFGKGDAKAALKIAMGKDEKIIRLPNDTYGLREWYGGAKKLDREKKGSASAESEPSNEETGNSPAPPGVEGKEGEAS